MAQNDVKNEKKDKGAPSAPATHGEVAQKEKTSFSQKRSGPRRRNVSQRRMRPKRAASDFAQKVIDVRRVARVVAGGRRFSFSVVIVLGDKKGSVGVGIGKAADTARAIDKATRNARKNMIKIETTKTMSISHEVDAKFGSARIILIPAKGRGLVAGSSARTVLDLAGLTDITAKILSRSKNKLNNARATVKALEALKQL